MNHQVRAFPLGPGREADFSSFVEKAAEYAESTSEIDGWFKQEEEDLTGIDPKSRPLGPPTECVIDTKALDAPDRNRATTR